MLSKLLQKNVRESMMRVRMYSSSINTDEYIQVPHYKEKSALYIRQQLPSQKTAQLPIYPRILTPDLDLAKIFDADNMEKSALSINLNARHVCLDLTRLKADYMLMRQMENKIIELEHEKEHISDQINHMVKANAPKDAKSRVSIQKTAEFQALIHRGNEVKLRINQILEELVPIQEIVQIACLRLPNSLHTSSLLVYALQTNNELAKLFSGSNELLSEENNSIVLFRLNHELIQKNKSQDSIKWKSALATEHNWSFIEQPHADSVLGNRYLTGEYARLEMALVNYVHAKLTYLNELNKEANSCGPVFEHVKGVSMFKTAIVEACDIYPSSSSKAFNVVRFSGAESPDHSHIELLHLTGSASLTSLLLSFVRTQLNAKHLPWTMVFLIITFGILFINRFLSKIAKIKTILVYKRQKLFAQKRPNKPLRHVDFMRRQKLVFI